MPNSNLVMAKCQANKARYNANERFKIVDRQINTFQIHAQQISVGLIEALGKDKAASKGQMPHERARLLTQLFAFQVNLENSMKPSAIEHGKRIDNLARTLDRLQMPADQLKRIETELLELGEKLESINQQARNQAKLAKPHLAQALELISTDKKTRIMTGNALLEEFSNEERELTQFQIRCAQVEINLQSAIDLLGAVPIHDFENRETKESVQKDIANHLHTCKQNQQRVRMLNSSPHNNVPLHTLFQGFDQQRKTMSLHAADSLLMETKKIKEFIEDNRVSSTLSGLRTELSQLEQAATKSISQSEALVNRVAVEEKKQAQKAAQERETRAAKQFKFEKPRKQKANPATHATARAHRSNASTAVIPDQVSHSDSTRSLSPVGERLKNNFFQSAQIHLDMAQDNCDRLLLSHNPLTQALSNTAQDEIIALRNKLETLNRDTYTAQSDDERALEQEITSLEKHIGQIERGEIEPLATPAKINPKQAVAIAPKSSKVVPDKTGTPRSVPSTIEQRTRSTQSPNSSASSLTATNSSSNGASTIPSANSAQTMVPVAQTPAIHLQQPTLPETLSRAKLVNRQVEQLIKLQKELREELDNRKDSKHPAWDTLRPAINVFGALCKKLYFDKHYVQIEFDDFEPMTFSEALRELNWRSTHPGFNPFSAADYLAQANKWLDELTPGIIQCELDTLNAQAQLKLQLNKT